MNVNETFRYYRAEHEINTGVLCCYYVVNMLNFPNKTYVIWEFLQKYFINNTLASTLNIHDSQTVIHENTDNVAPGYTHSGWQIIECVKQNRQCGSGKAIHL